MEESDEEIDRGSLNSEEYENDSKFKFIKQEQVY